MAEETKIGPHLLGRVPSKPDERDWKLRNLTFEAPAAVVDPVTLAKTVGAELALTTVTYQKWVATSYVNPGGSHWYKAFAALSAIIGSTPPTPLAKEWENTEPVLDQGNYGTCVGNGCAQWGNTLPVDDKFDEKVARAIYYEATVLDGAPDDPDSPGGGQQGATVRSGVLALKARSRLNAYARSVTIADAAQWVLAKGPIIMGTDWQNDMFTPDANGFVKPTGGYAGGHCYLFKGYDSGSKVLTFLNSWGPDWGVLGEFKMHQADAETLFQSQGEAWASLELPV